MPNRSVTINGRRYNSLSAASKKFRIAVGSVAHRCGSTLERWKGWSFDSNRRTRIPSSMSLRIGRNRYESMREASVVLGVAMSTIRTRLLSADYPTYCFVSEDGTRYRSGQELEDYLKKLTT